MMTSVRTLRGGMVFELRYESRSGCEDLIVEFRSSMCRAETPCSREG